MFLEKECHRHVIKNPVLRFISVAELPMVSLHGLASWGRPASPLAVGALFRLCRGFFHFIITTAVSVRARWKKGQAQPKENCFPSLVSQFMLGKWFYGQHTAELRQGSLATQRSYSDVTIFARVMFCHVFSVSSWELFVIACRR